jgi:hypothetical protein
MNRFLMCFYNGKLKKVITNQTKILSYSLADVIISGE